MSIVSLLGGAPAAAALLEKSAADGAAARGGSASGAAPNTEGLVFDANGAKFNGKQIALSDLISDESDRFTDAQKGQASELLLSREKRPFYRYIRQVIFPAPKRKKAGNWGNFLPLTRVT